MILKGQKVAPGVVLKIVPSTDAIWNQAMDEGLIKIFKDAGAMVSNAGCAGCAAGQVGQNGPGEVTISTGNRNFEGKQGKGFVYLASPAAVAASAVAGYITGSDEIPVEPACIRQRVTDNRKPVAKRQQSRQVHCRQPWKAKSGSSSKDDIDTDMIFHNRYLTITDIKEMGQYTFDNLKGFEDFAKKAKAGDIVLTSKISVPEVHGSRRSIASCHLGFSVSWLNRSGLSMNAMPSMPHSRS